MVEQGFVCECADPRCRRRLDVSMLEYEAIWWRAGRFLVAPGHERPPLSWIVEATDRYSVVQADHGDYWTERGEPDGSARWPPSLGS
jgi:hypothetical protein